MAQGFAWKGSASANALILAAGITAKSLAPVAAGGTSTFTVSTWPSDPYVGEAVRVWIEGDGGHTVANPVATTASDLVDIWVESDVGDSGATFQNVTGKNAEYAPGRYNIHVYNSDGNKTWTISSWVFDGTTSTQTHTITGLVNPNDETWTKTYWVDFNGTTTGMPANDSTNERVLSQAAFTALDDATSTGDKIRVRFRGGVDHTFTSAASWQQDADVVFVDTFDGSDTDALSGGEAGFVDNIGSYTGWSVFGPRPDQTNAPRWIFRDINMKGKYDPTTGDFDGGADIEFFSTGNVEDTAVSFYRCKGSGMDILIEGSGSETLDRDYRFATFDCEITDWNNFGLTFSGGSYEVFHRGCSVKQSPIAIQGAGARPGTDPDEADHNPTRISRFYRAGITQCELYSHSGWSALGGFYGIQQVIRLYMSFNPSGSKANILMNDLCGRVGIEWGTASSSETIGNTAECLFACNKISLDRQGGMVEMTHCGGLYSYSNAIYVSNLNQAISSNVYVLRRQRDWAIVSAAIWDSEGCSCFNTYFSDVDGTTNKETGTIDESVLDNHSTHGTPTGITIGNNLFSADGHTGSYVAASAFSRGDWLQPVSGSAADDTVTAGPPVDRKGDKRSNPTNKGAYHSATTSSSASAPSNSVAPTITLSTAEADIYTCTDIGTWSNIDPPLIDFTWQLDGVDDPTGSDPDLAHATKYDASGKSGDLTLIVGFTNISGSRVTATSNTIAI